MANFRITDNSFGPFGHDRNTNLGTTSDVLTILCASDNTGKDAPP